MTHDAETQLTRRTLVAGGLTAAGALLTGVPFHARAARKVAPWAALLIGSARSQIGVTVEYDGAYEALAFPGGDIPRERGVCTDVVIRAYRDAFGFDLQKEVNADMKRYFRAYPKRWGLKRPDRNIDHRRVPNLQTYFTRRGGQVAGLIIPGNFQPGDLITQMIGDRLPHIGIVSDRAGNGGRPLLLHNIGGGAQEEDVTATFPVTGHYRFNPTG